MSRIDCGCEFILDRYRVAAQSGREDPGIQRRPHQSARTQSGEGVQTGLSGQFADQRQRSRVGRTAQSLAVDADLPAQRGDDAADQAARRWRELPRINQLEDAQKGVLQRHAFRQREKAAQPGGLLCHLFGDVFDRGAAGHVK